VQAPPAVLAVPVVPVIAVAPVVPVAPPEMAAPLAPSQLPSDDAIAELLAATCAGAPPAGDPAPELTARVATSLSTVERAALSGAPLPLEAGPLRAAAVLRWRSAAVAEHARATGVVDPASEALPAAVDAALAALTALAASAEAQLQAAVLEVRAGLVTEAIAVTDALGAAASASVAAPVVAPARHAVGTRVISNDLQENADPERRSHALPIVLVLALLGAIAYHGYGYLARPVSAAPPRMDGAPEGFVLHTSPTTSARVLLLQDGRAVDPAEVERFRKEQELRGMAVLQVNPTTLVVKPLSEVGSAAGK
jgi:hypothetical protein